MSALEYASGSARANWQPDSAADGGRPALAGRVQVATLAAHVTGQPETGVGCGLSTAFPPYPEYFRVALGHSSFAEEVGSTEEYSGMAGMDVCFLGITHTAR